MIITKEEIDKIKKSLVLNKSNNCLEWVGYIQTKYKTNSGGYGIVSMRSKQFKVHRVVMMHHLQSNIPTGVNVLHKCDNRLCANIEHLFLGTQKENIQDAIGKGRMRTPASINSKKTHCINGHEFSADNLYINKKTKKRTCLACARKSQKKYMKRIKYG